MKYTCPKCGKVIELSTEALIASEYFTVCPQCLTRLQIVGNYAYVPLPDGTLELGSPAENEAEREPSVVTPPPLLPDNNDRPASPAGATNAVDPLLGEAIKFVSRCNAVTPVMLRDYFNIPMERAQALITQLEQAGVVGPYNGGAPRSILIPHRTELPVAQRPTYDDTADRATQQAKSNSTEPNNKTYTFTCSGCLTWFLIITVTIMLFRACG